MEMQPNRAVDLLPAMDGWLLVRWQRARVWLPPRTLGSCSYVGTGSNRLCSRYAGKQGKITDTHRGGGGGGGGEKNLTAVSCFAAGKDLVCRYWAAIPEMRTSKAFVYTQRAGRYQQQLLLPLVA